MIETVIFDMDGLLVDSERMTFEHYKIFEEKYGVVVERPLYEKFLGKNQRGIREIIVKECNIEEGKAAELMNDVYEAMGLTIEKVGVPLKKGTKELLNYLSQMNINKVVATSSHREHAELVLSKSSIRDYFDGIVCGNEVKKGKPAPEIFLKALDLVNGHIQKSLIVEDSENGVRGAHLSGMTCVHIPDMLELKDDVLDMADYVFSDLNGLKKHLESTIGRV